MKLEKFLRILLSVIFLMTGFMKLTMPQFGEAFLIQLSEAEIPFPFLNFWLVPVLEIAIGAMLLFNFRAVIALITTVPIMLVALYVHLVVSNPLAFPAQPKFPVIPIVILLIVYFLLNRIMRRAMAKYP